MLIKAGYEIGFDIPAPVSIVLMLYVHPDRAGDLEKPEVLTVEPHVKAEDFFDCFGNRSARIFAPAGPLLIRNDFVCRDTGVHEDKIDGAKMVPVEQLPPVVLQFLYNSRYCEVDKLGDIAWSLFGHTEPGWKRVQAVMDWCHTNVQFGYEFARATRTAMEVYEERKGVCRDFMHLAVTFMRCLNIPARYATGYLGDIGIPVQPFPMDFSAWFEVYLGGRWFTLDARHNEPRIGRILMGRGRDAADVALTTSFGPAQLTKFEVWTDEVK